MIRYYGFLANRARAKLLPRVYELLGQEAKAFNAPTFAELIEKNFGFNPLTCILCGAPLILMLLRIGLSSVRDLLKVHQELAQFKIPV